MTVAPAVYVGTVRHRRFAPVSHAFDYALFMVLLDVDRIPEAMRVSAFTSYNRWNWATFDERDHVGDPGLPLRERLHHLAVAAGERLPDGPIYLLTHLRYAGYCFNPISLYYCHDRDRTLQLVLADVSNTYGGRRSYWLRPSERRTNRFRAVQAKTMYVSPFMPPDVEYEFILTPPGEQLVAHMHLTPRSCPSRHDDRLFDATLTLTRHAWTAASVRTALLRFPWMTAKVIAAIHWEALKLRHKRLPEYPRVESGT